MDKTIDSTPSNAKKTKAGVFIIESLGIEDEKGTKEGEIIYGILQMSGIPVEYLYMRSYDEFTFFLDEFVKSNYRFLHISCHGKKTGIKLTFEEIYNDDLANLLQGKLKYRRLFLSACAAVNIDLAAQLFPKSGANSLIGPSRKVPMKEIAIFWASFYYLMFKANPRAMKKKDLIKNIDTLSKLYGIPIKYFKTSKNIPHYTEQQFTRNSAPPEMVDYDE